MDIGSGAVRSADYAFREKLDELQSAVLKLQDTIYAPPGDLKTYGGSLREVLRAKLDAFEQVKAQVDDLGTIMTALLKGMLSLSREKERFEEKLSCPWHANPTRRI